ncbi:MAG: EAL domain-containing protein [Lachnospiraceae bacterium]|nr:EAL domain-containing protein [Lachnospiraceae bacterium]
MEFGIQIVSLAVIVTIAINYFQNKRMPLLSTKLFTGLLSLAVCNITFEFLTLYTIYHIDQVPGWINRLCHQLFIGSLNFVVLFLFLYVDIKARKQKRYGLFQFALRIIPIAAAVIMVIFGRLEYYIGEDGRYSHGPMAVMVYVTFMIYFTLTVVILYRKREEFDRIERRTILHGITVWLLAALFQMVYPTSLISSMGVSLMVLFVYISLENPREYVDIDMEDTLNQRAFEVVLQEWFASRREFYLIVFTIGNEELLRNSYGSQMLQQIQTHLAEKMNSALGTMVYHLENKHLAVIIPRDVVTQELYEDMREACRAYNEMAELQIDVLKCPVHAENVEQAKDILRYVNENEIADHVLGIIRINQNIVEKFAYYRTVERIVQHAIEEDGLEVYYQPIYCTETGTFISAEALVRLKDTHTVGFISPELFIPIAEKRNMVGELGRIVFEKVCRFYVENHLADLGVSYIEVNLSGKQIVDSSLPETLRQCIEEYGICSSSINLEITETAAVNAKELQSDNMRKLKKAGFGFSMDDFGTGYSNLAEMTEMDFDLVKLDKSLIWPCFGEQREKALPILDACVEMIHNLGRHIVAEGVETEEQRDYLIERKVSYLQGYYYSKPLPEVAYLDFLIQNKKIS